MTLWIPNGLEGRPATVLLCTVVKEQNRVHSQTKAASWTGTLQE